VTDEKKENRVKIMQRKEGMTSLWTKEVEEDINT